VKRSGRKLARSLLLPLAVMGTSLFAIGAVFGARGLALAVVASVLWMAWRFDNHTGSIFLLVVLLLIALGVIALLMTLLAVVFGAVG
jgi:hypothetical protein